jgi:uncharacterized membrane protein YhiD involved in acid resistance
MVFKNKSKAIGLTTATLIWSTSAIEFSIGIGFHFAAIITAFLAMLILIPVEYAEKRILKTTRKKRNKN